MAKHNTGIINRFLLWPPEVEDCHPGQMHRPTRR